MFKVLIVDDEPGYRENLAISLERTSAVVRTAMGDIDGAIRDLERAYELRTPGVVSLKVNPAFDALHGERRFAALLTKMGLS